MNSQQNSVKDPKDTDSKKVSTKRKKSQHYSLNKTAYTFEHICSQARKKFTRSLFARLYVFASLGQGYKVLAENDKFTTR